MSSTMFNSKSRNKKFRTRRTSEDDEDNNGEAIVNKPQDGDVDMKDVPTTEEPQIKTPQQSAASDLHQKQPQKSTKKSLLTFGDEEEAETFQIKKNNTKPKKSEKKKLTLADLTEENEREQMNPNLQMNYGQSNDDYTPEKLAELRKNAKSIPVIKKTDDDIQVVLKNTTPLAKIEEPIEMTLKRLDDSAADESRSGLAMIPTESQIQSIKAKKDRMRRYGGGQDYIALNDDEEEGKNSALIREGSDDEDDEAFEDNRGSRIRFGDPTKPNKPNKKTLYDELEGSQEEDDDFAQWELDQLKKSGVKKSGKNIPAGIKGVMYEGNSLPEYRPPMKLEVVPTYEDLARRLQENLANMKVSNASRKSQLIKVQETIDAAEITIKKCETDMKSFSGQYTFFQEMKSYILDLTDCLEEKVNEIAALEKQFNGNYIALVNKSRKNKQNRKQKEYERVSTALNLPVAIKQESNGDAEYQKGNFRQEVLALKKEFDQKARAVFEDVYEEFSSIYQIKNKFQQWKWDYPESYEQASCALFLPQIFSPFVRTGTLTWSPFVDAPFFDQMKWWQTLFDYGLKNESDQLDPKDEDFNLIPKIIEKYILPRGTFFFSAIWNPFGAKQSANGLEFIKELVVYTAPEKIKDILIQVHISMQSAIDSVNIVLPKENLAPEIKQLCQKQFDAALKLMKNFALWTEFLPQTTMEKLLVDQLLNMKMIPYLRAIDAKSAVHLSEEIISALPQDWLKAKFMPALSIFSALLSSTLIKKVGSDQESIGRVIRLVSRLGDQQTVSKLNSEYKIPL